MSKLALLLLLVPYLASAQTVGNGVKVGTGVSFGGVVVTPPPSSNILFSPASGHYTGTQNVGITQTYGTGNSLFYTKDGSPVSEASTLYSSAIPLSASATMNALAESVGSVRQDVQNTQSLWKICTPLGGGPGTPTSSACGGVGSNQPSSWTILWNTTVGGISGLESISLSGTSGYPQILVTLGGHGCDSCTKATMDKWVKPIDSDTGIQNHEMDLWQNDGTRNREHMGGLQCNQQPGKLNWQIDNTGGDGWHNTGITDGCPLSPTKWTHVIFHIHWIIGDDGCADNISPSAHGGLGCIYYDDLSIGQGNFPGDPSTIMTKHIIGKTLQANTNTPAWGAGCADQDQVDLNKGPSTGGLLIAHNNVTCSFGTSGTASASYTF